MTPAPAEAAKNTNTAAQDRRESPQLTTHSQSFDEAKRSFAYGRWEQLKSNLKVQDIDEFTGILKEFKDFFPEFKGRKVIGVVTGIRFDEGVERYAEREGLYLLIPSLELMELGNSPNFKPKIWDKDECE